MDMNEIRKILDDREKIERHLNLGRLSYEDLCQVRDAIKNFVHQMEGLIRAASTDGNYQFAYVARCKQDNAVSEGEVVCREINARPERKGCTIPELFGRI